MIHNHFLSSHHHDDNYTLIVCNLLTTSGTFLKYFYNMFTTYELYVYESIEEGKISSFVKIYCCGKYGAILYSIVKMLLMSRNIHVYM